jgi:hypothetical protein
MSNTSNANASNVNASNVNASNVNASNANASNVNTSNVNTSNANASNASNVNTSNTEWTDELETQLKYLGECAQGYVRMYKMDILKYSAYQQRWTSGSISAGVISSALLTLSLALGIEHNQVMIIISTLLSFGSSVCHGYLYQVDYASIIADLKRQTAKYSGLQNNIKRQLSLSRDKREKAEDYHYWITNNYDQLSETSLNIHPDTIELYRKICKDSNLPFPDENADDAKIVVHVETGHVSTCPPIRTSLLDVISQEDKSTLVKVVKGDSLRGQVNIQEALRYTDQHMQYELNRLTGHTE